MDITFAAILVLKLTFLPGQLPVAKPYYADHLSEQEIDREYERLLLKNVVLSRGEHHGFHHFVGIDPNSQQFSLQIAF